MCKARSWVDYALMENIQRVHPGYVLDGVKVNDIPPIWPFSELRQIMIQHCRMFVEQMEGAHEMRRLTPESEFQIWGPLRHRVLDTGYEAKLRKRADPRDVRNTRWVPRVVGHTKEEDRFPAMVDFVFKAYFVAFKGYKNEGAAVA